MSKIYVNATIHNQNSQTKINGFGFFDEEKQVLSWTDSKQTTYSFNLVTKELIKEDQKTILNYTFCLDTPKEGQIFLKEFKQTFFMTLLTESILLSDHHCEIQYRILEDEDKENGMKLILTWKHSIEK